VSDRRKQRAVAAPMKRATGSHRPEVAIAGVGVLSIATAAAGIGVRYGVPGFLYGLIGPLSWWHGAWSDRRAPR
jgi:hypothetical protein